MHYNQRGISPLDSSAASNQLDQQIPGSSNLPNILAFPPSSLDISFDDLVIDQVKMAWKKIMQDEGDGGVDESEFMKFESRENVGDE